MIKDYGRTEEFRKFSSEDDIAGLRNRLRELAKDFIFMADNFTDQQSWDIVRETEPEKMRALEAFMKSYFNLQF